jgi:hypothetical protein
VSRGVSACSFAAGWLLPGLAAWPSGWLCLIGAGFVRAGWRVRDRGGAVPGRVSGAAGVLDALVREPIMAGAGKGRGRVHRLCGCGRPIAGCPAGRPAGCLHPFGCAPASCMLITHFSPSDATTRTTSPRRPGLPGLRAPTPHRVQLPRGAVNDSRSTPSSVRKAAFSVSFAFDNGPQPGDQLMLLPGTGRQARHVGRSPLIMLNLNQRFKHPAQRVANQSRVRPPVNGHNHRPEQPHTHSADPVAERQLPSRQHESGSAIHDGWPPARDAKKAIMASIHSRTRFPASTGLVMMKTTITITTIQPRIFASNRLPPLYNDPPGTSDALPHRGYRYGLPTGSRSQHNEGWDRPNNWFWFAVSHLLGGASASVELNRIFPQRGCQVASPGVTLQSPAAYRRSSDLTVLAQLPPHTSLVYASCAAGP